MPEFSRRQYLAELARIERKLIDLKPASELFKSERALRLAIQAIRKVAIDTRMNAP